MKFKSINQPHTIHQEQGYTLLEIMVALFVGLLLVGTIFQLYITVNQNNRNIKYLAELQENGRMAIDFIEKDLHRAGYFAGNDDIDAITNIAIATTTCAENNSWGRMLQQPVHGINVSLGATSTGYACIDDKSSEGGAYLRGDVMTVRYVNPKKNSGYQAAEYYLRTDLLFSGEILTGAATVATATSGAEADHQLVAHSFYIGQSADTCQGKPIPALFWQTLESGIPVDEELITGIENLQFEYGIDTDADGTPNQYKDAPSASEWEKVVTVRVYVLVRSECSDNRFTDNKTHTLAGVDYSTADSNYQRQLFTTTVALRNSQ